MAFLVGGANSASGAYEIENSLRFNDDDSPSLSRANDSGGSNTTGTLSFWAKRSEINTSYLFYAHSDNSNVFNVYFSSSSTNRLEIRSSQGGSVEMSYKANMKFRDVSAWYHIVIAIDTTDGTAADRCKLFVNGSRITSFETQTNFGSSDTIEWFQSDATVYVSGEWEGGTIASPHDGYIADLNFVDGTQYDASYFGETNDNGVWIPKKFTGTQGTNGFRLEFQQTGTSANASGIGADTSGNDNHLTVSNLAATDITTDTPTNNFCTLNSLTAGTYPELREGNLQQYEHGSSDSSGVAATMMPINGKWYAELYLNAPSAGDYPMLGITDTINLNQKGAGGSKMAAGFEIDGVTNNQSTNNLGTITNTNTGWPTFADNDIVMFALDCDNRKLWIGRQGTWINSGDPAGESNHQLSWTVDANVCPFLLGYDNSQSGGGADESIWNYGNPPFAISSSQADDNGYGNFEHDVPTGFYALCTKNLAEYG